MRSLSIMLAAIALIAILGICIVGCGGDDSDTAGSQGAGPGERPTLYKGDEWKYQAFNGEGEYQITLSVVDVGKNYTLKMEIDPPLQGMISETTAEFDKALLLPVSIKMSGEQMGISFSFETEASYEIISGERWPLAVGKELNITESTSTTIEIGGDTSTETATEVSTYKVEAIEEITVKAGTFECYRIAQYDESGQKVSTSWHSDKVKTQVKEVDHEVGETQELVDYSVK